MSIGTDQGEVLIPTVINGRVVSDQEAIDHFNRTGENFGTFRTPDEATAYANALHNRHAQQLRQRYQSPDDALKDIGAFITSAGRDDEHNRRVGGVENSRHLIRRGAKARDIRKTRGMTKEKIRQAVEASGVRVAELLDEGDHFHVAWH